MAADKPGWAEIIADLEAKRAALDSLIGSFRAAMALGALGQPGDVDMSGIVSGASVQSGNAGAPVELPAGAFLGKSLPAAIKIYLAAVKRKQHTREIIAALKDGGVETTSPNFDNVVFGALTRLKAAGEVLRFKDGWGLTEFYPESLRQRLTQETGSRTKKKGTKATKKTRQKKGADSRKTGDATIDDRVLAAMKAEPEREFTPSELVAELGAQPNGIGLALARLVRYQRVERQENGAYMLREVDLRRVV
jgi:hypothetical protein